MLNKKLILLIFFGIVLINCASATTFYFGDLITPQRQDACFNIPMSCDNCTYMNITILFPNGTTIIENQATTNLSSLYYYNYTFCNTSALGKYWIITNYDEDGNEYSDINFFEVTPNGVELTLGKSILYMGVLFLLLIFLIISIIGIFKVEHYIGKFTLYWVSHLLIVIWTFSIWQITDGFLVGFIGLAGVFKVFFYVFIIAIFPMIILSIAWVVYIHLFNEHFQKLVDKGEDPETAFAMTKKKVRKGIW